MLATRAIFWPCLLYVALDISPSSLKKAFFELEQNEERGSFDFPGLRTGWVAHGRDFSFLL